MKLKRIQKKMNYLSLLILLVGILFISGCTMPTESPVNQTGAGTAEPPANQLVNTVEPSVEQPAQGLEILVKDIGFPDVKYLQPTIKEIQLQKENGEWITIWLNPNGKTVKLTPDGAEVSFGTVSVAPGTYIGTRLMVSTMDVEIDINRDGDTVDKNIEIILTEEEFNSIPEDERPPAPQGAAPTEPSPPSEPTDGQDSPDSQTPPQEPSQPSQPQEPEKPVWDKPHGEEPGEESPEPSEPTAPSEPEEPSQPSQGEEPSQPSEPEEPQAPYRIENGLVYTGTFLDEKDTVSLNRYLIPIFKDKFIYPGSGGKIVYDFTLHPTAPKIKQISVEVSIVISQAIPATANAATVILDNFDNTTKGDASGVLIYDDSIPNLNKAANLVKDTHIKYSFTPWYRWDGFHNWGRNEAAGGVNTEGRIELWVKPSTDASGKSTGILTFEWFDTESAPPAGYILHFGRTAERKLIYSVWGGHSENALVGNTIIPSDQWTKVAVSWSSAGTKLYVNEKLDAYTSGNMWPAFSGTVYVYLNYWGADNLGLVDELHILNVAEPFTTIP